MKQNKHKNLTFLAMPADYAMHWNLFILFYSVEKLHKFAPWAKLAIKQLDFVAGIQEKCM